MTRPAQEEIRRWVQPLDSPGFRSSVIRQRAILGFCAWGGGVWFRPFLALASHACIAYTLCMQYTIRRVPEAVDSAIRARARASGKSLNEAAVEALTEGAGVAGAPRKRRDLADIAGTWKGDKAAERALAEQDKVDEDLWR